MQNKQRGYTDSELYFDRLDTFDLDQVTNIFKKSRTYYFDRICIKSVQGQAMNAGTATLAVAWAPMLATDIVMCQQMTTTTAAYIITQTISASTGFTVVYNTAPGVATFDWAVFRLVSALT